MSDPYTVMHRQIPWHPADGPDVLPLNRHVRHDSRSRRYPWIARGAALRSVLHPRRVPILDQLKAGSCTGNAVTGALGTDPLFAAVPAGTVLDEALALKIYSAAEVIDGDGPYPPQDNGSSGLSACQAAKDLGLLSGYLHAFSLAAVLDALQDTPLVTGVNWYDCLPDGQRVLTSDLRWVPIEKLQVGDELIGFDESIGQGARYRRSRVTALGTKNAPVYEIRTDQGTVCSSDGHQFVRCSSVTSSGGQTKGRQEWVRADRIRSGDRLAYFMAPYEDDTSWEAGWLAGFFDGEGTVSGDYQLNFGQAVGPTLSQAIQLMQAKGYETSIKQYRLPATDGRGITSRKPFANVYVAGGYHGALRFLGEVRPGRLLAHAGRLWEGKATKSRRCPPAIVQDVRMIGVEPVHTIGTTTQTLIAEGFLSHNSFDSPDSSGLVTISPGAVIRGGHELEVRGIDVITQEVLMDNSWSAGWGLNGSLRMRWVTYERLLSEQGDATVPVPLSQPAPVPVPPGASPAAIALQAVAGPWAASLRTRPDLVALQHAIRDWELAEGFTAVR